MHLGLAFEIPYVPLVPKADNELDAVEKRRFHEVGHRVCFVPCHKLKSIVLAVKSFVPLAYLIIGSEYESVPPGLQHALEVRDKRLRVKRDFVPRGYVVVYIRAPIEFDVAGAVRRDVVRGIRQDQIHGIVRQGFQQFAAVAEPDVYICHSPYLFDIVRPVFLGVGQHRDSPSMRK
jgi:hypothetical protein